MWKNKKVSVIFPCYNEGKNIINAIKDFSNEFVDEIIVVDNNSSDGSKEKIKSTDAKYVLETRQGYGYALRRGMEEATGDLIITAEPDNSFIGEDILKLLVYSNQFDVVFGTRTSKSLIWSGAKMGFFLRLGNVVVAKFLEFLHNGTSLTDVGCTLKLINRKSYEKIKNKFKVGGNHFSPEFMIICIRSNLNCVEIPVNYRERLGVSKITSNFWKTFKLGMIIIFLIINYRFKKI